MNNNSSNDCGDYMPNIENINSEILSEILEIYYSVNAMSLTLREIRYYEELQLEFMLTNFELFDRNATQQIRNAKKYYEQHPNEAHNSSSIFRELLVIKNRKIVDNFYESRLATRKRELLRRYISKESVSYIQAINNIVEKNKSDNVVISDNFKFTEQNNEIIIDNQYLIPDNQEERKLDTGENERRNENDPLYYEHFYYNPDEDDENDRFTQLTTPGVVLSESDVHQIIIMALTENRIIPSFLTSRVDAYFRRSAGYVEEQRMKEFKKEERKKEIDEKDKYIRLSILYNTIKDVYESFFKIYNYWIKRYQSGFALEPCVISTLLEYKKNVIEYFTLYLTNRKLFRKYGFEDIFTASLFSTWLENSEKVMSTILETFKLYALGEGEVERQEPYTSGFKKDRKQLIDPNDIHSDFDNKKVDELNEFNNNTKINNLLIRHNAERVEDLEDLVNDDDYDPDADARTNVLSLRDPFEYYDRDLTLRVFYKYRKLSRGFEFIHYKNKLMAYIINYGINKGLIINDKETLKEVEERLANTDEYAQYDYGKVFDMIMKDRIPPYSEMIKYNHNKSYQTKVDSSKWRVNTTHIQIAQIKDLEHIKLYDPIQIKETDAIDNIYITKYNFSYSTHLNKLSPFYFNYSIQQKIFTIPYLPILLYRLRKLGVTVVALFRKTEAKIYYHIYHQVDQTRRNTLKRVFIVFDGKGSYTVSANIPKTFPDEFKSNDFRKGIDVEDLIEMFVLSPRNNCPEYLSKRNLEIPPQFYYKERQQLANNDKVYNHRHDFVLSFLIRRLEKMDDNYKIYKEINIEQLLYELNMSDKKSEFTHHELSLTPDIYIVRRDYKYVMVSELGVSQSADTYLKNKQEKYVDLIKKLNSILGIPVHYGPIIYNTKTWRFNYDSVIGTFLRKFKKMDFLFKPNFDNNDKIMDVCNAISSIAQNLNIGTIIFEPRIDNISAIEIRDKAYNAIKIAEYNEEEFGGVIKKVAELKLNDDYSQSKISESFSTPYSIINTLIATEDARLLYKDIKKCIRENKRPIPVNLEYDNTDDISQAQNRNILEKHKLVYRNVFPNKVNGSKPKRLESAFFVPISFQKKDFKSGNNREKVINTANVLLRDIKMLNAFDISKHSKNCYLNLDNFLRSLKSFNYTKSSKITDENIVYTYPRDLDFITTLFKIKEKAPLKTDSPISTLSLNDNTMKMMFAHLSANSLYNDISLYIHLKEKIDDLETFSTFQDDYIEKFKLFEDSLTVLCKNIIYIAHEYYKLSFHFEDMVKKPRKYYTIHSGHNNNILYIINSGASNSYKNVVYRYICIHKCDKWTYHKVYKKMFSIAVAFETTDPDQIIFVTNPTMIKNSEIYQMRLLESQLLSALFYAFCKLTSKKENKLSPLEIRMYLNKLSKIIFCANRLANSEGCTFLSNVRYLVSILSSGVYDLYNIIDERFPKYITSYPMQYLFSEFYVGLFDVIKPNFYEAEFQGDVYNIKSIGIFTHQVLDDVDLILLEQYLTKFTQKEHKKKIHAIRETLETIKKYQTDEHHYFDTDIIYKTTRLFKKGLSLDLINNIIHRSYTKKLINEVKSTSTYHCKDPDLSSGYTRVKVSDAILAKIKAANFKYDLTLEEVIMSADISEILISPSVKEETKGYRETNVTTLEVLCGLKVIDNIAMEINKRLGVDDICNKGDKKFLKYQDIINQAYKMYSTTKPEILRSSNDGKKWSTGDSVLTEFLVFGVLVTDYTKDYLIRLFNEMRKKRITDYVSIVEKVLWILANLSGRVLTSTEDTEKVFLEVFGKTSVKLYYGWPEGFLNSLSSLKHALSYLACSIFIKYSAEEKKDRVRFYFRVHSDDSFHIILASSKINLIYYDTNITFIKAFFQSICNKTKDIKSFLIKTMQEYLSNFNIINSIIPARFVHAISSFKDLSGISYASDIKSAISRLLEGLRYGLGNYWYELNIRLINMFVRRCHKLTKGMKNSIKYDIAWNIPEEFGGAFYCSAIMLNHFSTLSNHLRLAYLNKNINLLHNLYHKTDTVKLSEAKSGEILGEEEFDFVDEPQAVVPKIYYKHKNKEVLNNLFSEAQIKELLLYNDEGKIPDDFNFYSLSDYDKYRFIVTNIWGKSGAISYSGIKSYVTLTSKLSYSNITYRNKEYTSLDDIISNYSCLNFIPPNIEDVILLRDIQKKKFFKFIKTLSLKSLKFEDIPYQSCSLHLLNNNNILDDSLLKEVGDITLKDLKFDAFRNAIKNSSIEHKDNFYTDKMIMDMYKKMTETRQYHYINFNTRLSTDIGVSDYLIAGFLYPDKQVKVINLKYKIKEHYVTIDEKLQKEKYVVDQIVSYISTQALILYFNKSKITFLDFITGLEIFYRQVSNNDRKKVFDYIYDFLTLYIEKVDLSNNYTRRDLFIYKNLQDLMNTISITNKDIKSLDNDIYIYYKKIYDNDEIVSIPYEIEIAKFNDIYIDIQDGFLYITGCKESDMNGTRINKKLALQVNLRFKLTRNQVRTIFTYYNKIYKIETYDDNFEQFITERSLDYNTYEFIDDFIEYNFREDEELSIYKESGDYYLGFVGKNIKRFVLSCSAIKEGDFEHISDFRKECEKSRAINYFDRNITLDLGYINDIPILTYVKNNSIYYKCPLYLGFSTAQYPSDAIIKNYSLNKVLDLPQNIKYDHLLKIFSFRLNYTRDYRIPLFYFDDLLFMKNINFTLTDKYRIVTEIYEEIIHNLYDPIIFAHDEELELLGEIKPKYELSEILHINDEYKDFINTDVFIRKKEGKHFLDIIKEKIEEIKDERPQALFAIDKSRGFVVNETEDYEEDEKISVEDIKYIKGTDNTSGKVERIKRFFNNAFLPFKENGYAILYELSLIFVSDVALVSKEYRYNYLGLFLYVLMTIGYISDDLKYRLTIIALNYYSDNTLQKDLKYSFKYLPNPIVNTELLSLHAYLSFIFNTHVKGKTKDFN